jgi:hypothetical protein
MKIKIIEGTIVQKEFEVLTADESRAISERERDRFRREKEEAERKHLEALTNRCQMLFPSVIASILEDIKLNASKGYTSTSELKWYVDNRETPYGMNWEEFQFMRKDIQTFFENLGYNFIYHEYCQSWVTRSKQLGYMWVSWRKID